MKITGHIKKMVTSLESPVEYQLPVDDKLVSLNDYIGKSIYVITKAEVRYEGTLIDVDREKKIMSLRNVS